MPLAAQAHPQLMGSTFRDGFPELWESIQPVFDEARRTGRGVEQSAAMPLMVERRGWREEAFFSGNFVPLSSRSTSQPEGFYNALIEVTDQQLAERRTTMLNRMASVPDPTLNAVYAHILKTLETNGNDIPLALLYEAKDRLGPTGLRLRGHIGLPTGHNLIVDGSDMDSLDGLIPDCRRADTAELVLIDYDERFGSISWGGFGSPSKKLAILPITSGSRIFAYLIVGTNPCRPLDDHCEQFLKNLGRMVSSIIFAAVNAEEAMKRQQQLESQLAFSDLKLRHLIEHASIGMAHMSLQGETLWANEHHYALSGRDAHDQQSPMAFLDGCLDEDRPKAQRAWDSLLESDNHVSVEVRTKRLFKSPIGDAEPAQVQILAFPYREHGITKSVMSCTTDISKLKWAQTFQARLAAEAREAKRQQEAFIDVVSHEMRNPLSAIVHCADGISNALDECHSKLAEIPQPCLDALTDNVAAANIIMQCANHQKRIIDDVLTLSRLDSMLLSITPSAVRPPKLVNSITGMFEAELKSHRIRCSVEPDASLSKLAIDYLYFDPSRVTQIFINLVTNAIKFVKPSNDRSISIRYGACLSDPHAFFAQDMFWATRSKHDCDVTANPEWGQGDEIYLTFLVQDSGIGLKSKDTHKIFERFGQANGRTHVNYGGSGLGLFISKELTEKQGGEIGVSSTLGNGSTFGFYIKARRVERPPQTLGELYHDSGKAGQAPEQLHVLLVEDNIINQQVLGKQLKKAGCLVDVANHGLEALDMLEKKTFDVVLMDLEMPVLNGLAAMQEIRKREVDREGLLGQALNDGLRGEQRLPIIAVTANVRQEQIDNAIAVGADRVMQKPFKATDLVHMMKGLVPQVTTPSTELPAPGLDGRIGDLVP
ncbi:autoinducer 2 sensor kinase/phosphatase luxQ [Massariosphaeria phaeospora]|uniref:histidine kinase n=1 Tax=Massariosphaeria phaeospora TaxID=100035 RepID=A0A7C8I3U8_9PLEO|nr:autoinducer 2 sensor kinase/phosphatase luxQ [Massariosphaeria phaeospora]